MYIKIKFNFSTITSSIFFQNGKYLICGNQYGLILMYKINEKKKYFLNLHNSSINHIKFHSNILYVIFSDGKCKMIDTEKYEKIQIFENSTTIINNIDCCNQILITTNNHHIIKFWDKRIKSYFESIFCGFNLKTVNFLYKPFSFVTMDVFSEIFIWDLRKIQKKNKYCFTNKKKKLIEAAQISKNRKFFFVSDLRNNFFEYTLNTDLVAVKCNEIESPFTFVKIIKKKKTKSMSCDKRNLFFGCGSQTGEIAIWSQKKKKIIYKNKEHQGNVNYFDFHPNDNIFCSCGNDKNVIIKKFLY